MRDSYLLICPKHVHMLFRHFQSEVGLFMERSSIKSMSVLKQVPLVHLLGGLAASSLVLLVYHLRNRKRLQQAPPVRTLIVKYGGSAITNKTSFETLDNSSLSKCSTQLRTIHSEKHWSNIIIVHGAGSFGHFHAKKYGLKFGGFDIADSGQDIDILKPWQTGLTLTRQSVVKLNTHVVDAHVSLGLPVVTVSTFPSVVTGYSSSSAARNAILQPHINSYGSHIVEAGALREVNNLLSGGFIPVLHGDVVLDRSQQCAVLGGDHIIHWICQNLFPASTWSTAASTDVPSRIRVVFLTDVAGVFDRAPRLPGATLIRRINVLPDGTTDMVAATETAAHDVTGGIEAKVQAAVGMAQLGRHVEVYIVQVGSDSALQALRGEVPTLGTLIALK